MPRIWDHHWEAKPRLYGVAEIADELNMDRRHVAVWRQRGFQGFPSPDATLAGGPVWFAETIEPWLAEQARRSGEVDRDAQATEAARGLALALLRLTALTSEPPPRRPGLISRTARELTGTIPDQETLVRIGGSPLLGRLGPLLTKPEILRTLDVPPELEKSRGPWDLGPDYEARVEAVREVLIETLPGVVDLLRAVEKKERALSRKPTRTEPPSAGSRRRGRRTASPVADKATSGDDGGPPASEEEALPRG